MKLARFSSLVAFAFAGVVLAFIFLQQTQTPKDDFLVHAQDFMASPVASSSGTTPDDLVEASPVDPNEFAQVTQDYFDQVQAYRDAEDKYTISQQQYYQLNTLTAEEDVVAKARVVLQARAQVLQTYFMYLRLLLLQTKGIEVNDKQSALNQLQAQAAILQDSQQRIGVLTKRSEVTIEFAILNQQGPDLQSLAYSVQALIKVGQVQTALDQAYTSQDLTAKWLAQAQVTEADRQKKQRGLDEVSQVLQRAKNDLAEVVTAQRRQERLTESSYHEFQSSLEDSYLQLRQASSFLSEVIQE